jgi:hypothetical protein
MFSSSIDTDDVMPLKPKASRPVRRLQVLATCVCFQQINADNATENTSLLTFDTIHDRRKDHAKYLHSFHNNNHDICKQQNWNV